MNTILLLKKNLIIAALLLSPFWATAQFFNTSLKKNVGEDMYKQAVQETKKKNYAAAIALSGKAINESPKNVDYNLLLGRLYIITKQYPQARPYILKVLDKSPKYRDAYACAISMELGEGNLPRALYYVNEGLSHFPDDFEFNTKKLSILDASRMIAPGDTLAEELAQQYPGNPETLKALTEHYRQAGAYYKGKGFNAQSKIYYARMLTLSPDNDEATNALSNINIETGDYTAALQQIRVALSKHPASYELMMKKLALLQEMHRYADALAVLKVLKTN